MTHFRKRSFSFSGISSIPFHEFAILVVDDEDDVDGVTKT